MIKMTKAQLTKATQIAVQPLIDEIAELNKEVESLQDYTLELRSQFEQSEYLWRRQQEEIAKLKQQKIEMRKECNRRFSEQLQKIRKLEAEKMMQIQDELFKESE